MKIESKRGKGEKMHISLDGEYAVTVDAVYWYTCGIENGAELSDEDAEAFLSAAFSRRAFNKAVDLISRRDYCCRELFDRLKRDFPEDAAQYAVDSLLERGYLDDEEYAHKLARHLRDVKHYGAHRIKSELIFRGIDRETAQQSLEALDIDARECIIELLETKFASCLDDEKGVRRTFNTLMRMGYGAGDIRSALRELDDE